MSKLSKPDLARHQKAEALLQKEFLTIEEKHFVLENWNEGAEHFNGIHGAFFTPLGLARDMVIELTGLPTIDLCAGIGMLGFVAMHYGRVKDLTCVEMNPRYVEVGKKVLPEATWICGSILDGNIIGNLPRFSQAISNPPFGAITKVGSTTGLKYSGADFEFITIEVASKLAKYGVFIMPQQSTPFRYSGGGSMKFEKSAKFQKFEDQTGLEMEFNCGIDTSQYLDDWKEVKPLCEIVRVDFQNQGTLF